MAAEPDGLFQRRGRGSGKHATAPAEAPAAAASPCGACKFLRRKCISGCVFAPYFSSDQGAARFAAVHKVFGASNVSKLLLHIPANRRSDAVVTISYEAQARLSDPVYGCVSTILALQQQVASLQAELAMVQHQLISNRIAVANAIHSTQQQQHIHGVLQPAYSNNSSTSNNSHLLHMPSFDLSAAAAVDTSHSFLPIHLSRPLHDEEEVEVEVEEEISHNPLAFAKHMLHQR